MARLLPGDIHATRSKQGKAKPLGRLLETHALDTKNHAFGHDSRPAVDRENGGDVEGALVADVLGVESRGYQD